MSPTKATTKLLTVSSRSEPLLIKYGKVSNGAA